MDFNQSPQLKESVCSRLRHIREEFFDKEGIKQFKHLDANKSLKAIVYFVFNIIVFVSDECKSMVSAS
jgi:hypothetical protein